MLCGALAGCGYTTRSMLNDKYRTIYIPPIANKVDITTESYTGSQYKVYRPLLESDVTNALANRFLFDGNLRPTSKAGADLTLKAELVEFRRDALRYTDNDDVLEYRLSVVVNMKLLDKENKILWAENNFTGDTTYFTQGTAAKSEDAAVTDAINDLAQRIVDRVVEQW